MSTPPEGQQPQQQVPTPADVAQKAAETPPPAPEQSKTFSQEYVHELREEAKGYRVKLSETETALQELQAWREEQERAKLSESERFQLEYQETQERLQAEAARAAEYQLQYEVALRAGRMGIQDPQDAVRLLDWDALEFNETGDVTNMDTVLTELVRSKPYLKGAVPPITTQVESNPSQERAPGAELTIAQIRQMKPEEINARWAEIEPILAAQGR